MVRNQEAHIKDQSADTRNKRLNILGYDELQELYGLPRFSDEERAQYFSLTPAELTAFDELHSVKSKIAFILQLGYFNARHMFFVFNASEVAADVSCIVAQYFPDAVEPDCTVTKVTRLKHQRLILDLCQYKMCDDIDRQQLEAKARKAAIVSSKPIYVFHQTLSELEAQHLAIPGYSFLQDMVGRALSFEQRRLVTVLQQHLIPCDRERLKALLEDDKGFYHVTQLKREPRDFSMAEIKREIERGQQIEDLYRLSQRVLPSLKVSNESIKYYASLVGYYSVYRLKRFELWTTYLYLLCFVQNRYQQHHDNLLATFIYYVRKFSDATKAAARDRVYEHRVEANRNLQKAAQVLKLFTSDNISEDTLFREVRNKAFSILGPDKLDHVAENIVTKLSFDEKAFQWEHIDKLGYQFKRYLRPILSSVEVSGAPTQSPLVKEGLLLRKQGAGTYIAPPIEQSGEALRSFTEDALNRGEAPSTIWLIRAIVLPTEDEAKQLQIKEKDQVVRLGRVRLSNGEPLAIEHAVISATMLPNPDDIGDSSYQVLAKNGCTPIKGTQRIQVSFAAPTEAGLLSIQEGGPVLRIERSTFLADGTPVEYTRSAYRGDKYVFVTDLHECKD